VGRWQRTTPCERTRRSISLHLDGEISDLEEAALQRHLERCTPCGALAAELAGLTELLRAAPLEEPRRSLAPEPSRGWRKRPARRRVGAALAFAASLGSAFAILSVPTVPELLVPAGGAIHFANHRDAMRFVRSKDHTLEPFLGVSDAAALRVSVPVFSQRALR
jgi:predicted anti-sigma-YlaC factor YlaD